METYDPEKIGKRIAWGRTHWVYHYGNEEVIRLPTLEQLAWGPNLQARYERDIAVSKKYLGDYALDTRVCQHPEKKRIATIQPYITGHYLTKEDLADSFTKRQFDDFIHRHDQLMRDGYQPFDLMGQGGVLHRHLSNIMVLPDKTLRLFDILIMDTFGLRHFQHPALWFRKPVKWRQASIIRFLQS